jgi:hypothetical protein
MDFKKYREIPSPKRTEDRHGYLHRAGVFFRRVLPFLVLALALALMASVVLNLRNTFWRYYTDDFGVRREADDPRVRFILWSNPETPSGDWRSAGEANGVKFHPDDGRMFVSMQALGAERLDSVQIRKGAGTGKPETGRPRPGNRPGVGPVPQLGRESGIQTADADTNRVETMPGAETNRLDADLFITEWNGKRWSEPMPLAEFNTTAGEYELVESRDGRWRFFTSDRTGGAGGVDVWVAAWNGRQWVGITNLAGVNSTGNERGLALTPDGHTLYFASDRSTERSMGGFDIYRATLAEQEAGILSSNTVSPPVVTAVESVLDVNSETDDFLPELTPRGDMLYFASNRKGGLGGYDIYAARIVQGQAQTPENLGVEINTADDEVGPAVRMEGFDLMFRSNRRQADKSIFPLYSATCREVISTFDLSRLDNYLQLLNRMKWWALIFAAALAALIYLAKRYRDLTNRFHKCLMASVIAHMAALMVIAVYTISKEVVESLKEPEAMEVMVDPRTMQELKKRMESMAVDQSKTMAKIAAFAPMATVQDRGGAPMPETTPTVEGNGPVIVAKSSDKTFVTMVTPSAASPLKGENMRNLKNLADVKLASLDAISLEEPPTAEGHGEVAGGAAGGAQGGARDSDRLVEAAMVQRKVASDFRKINDMPVSPVAQAVTVEEVLPENGPGPRIVVARNVIAAKAADAAPSSANVQAVPSLRGVVTALDIGADGVLLEVPTELPGAPGGVGAGATGTGTGGVIRAGTADGEGFNPGVAQYAAGSGFSRAYSVGRLRNEGGGAGVSDVVGFGGADMGQGTPLKDTGGSLPVASAGGDRRTHVPKMDGHGSVLGTERGGTGAGDLKFKLPGELDVPAGFMERNPADLVHWVGRPSAEVVEALGGSSATEGAIKGSLEWFSRTQEKDGRWDSKKHGGEVGHDVAATSLALLCYFGWGMKHNDACDYQRQVKAAVEWMLRTIKPDGDLCNENTRNGMYDQGIGTIALCEAYGVTRDPALYGPASNAVKFIVNAQGAGGGWRYQPGIGADLSVFGWQFMALHSAKLAKVPFDEAALLKASNWIDSVSAGANGGFYGYDGPNTTGDRPSMMAVGMFCRQLQKFAPGHDRMKETATWLRARPLGGGASMDVYYLYYTTLALYQHQGEIWEEWNKRMKEIVPPLQVKTGDDAGSWNPSGPYGGRMGRAVMTGLTTLSLEVYYRYLPMYGYREKDE